VVKENARVEVDLGFATVTVDAPGTTAAIGAKAAVSIRSELLRLLEADVTPGDDAQAIRASYVEAVYLGLTTSHLVRLPDDSEIALRHLSADSNEQRFEPGNPVFVGWRTEDARLHLS